MIIMARGNYFGEDRMRRFRQIQAEIKEVGEAVYKKFLANLSINYGLSPKKAKEYLKTLEDAGQIKLEKDVLGELKIIYTGRE